MENNEVNKATYSFGYRFKPQIKRVKRGVQVDRHGYHIMKAVDFAAIQGFHFVPKTKHFEHCETVAAYSCGMINKMSGIRTIKY